jgi:RNA ligase (TIGR02306 family)
MSDLKVEVCEVVEVNTHPNADLLDLLTVKGWVCVEKKGRYKVGDLVVYFPPDSILPVELSDRLNCTQYLSKQRLKAARLRGIVSCGLVAPNEGKWPLGEDLTAHYGITKYEPPEPGYNAGMGGQNLRDIGPFHTYTNIDNWNNYPGVLIENEEVVVTEKIHGTNARFGLVDGEFFVGSHRRIKAKDEKIVYWEAAIKYNVEQVMKERLHPARCWVIFGEVFGRVQDIKYGLGQTIDLRVFDISKDETYLDYDEFESLMKKLELPMVPLLYRGPYSAKLLAQLAEGQAFQGDHIKEGVVVRTATERWHSKLHRVILKKINPAYLVRKGGTEFQ